MEKTELENRRAILLEELRVVRLEKESLIQTLKESGLDLTFLESEQNKREINPDQKTNGNGELSNVKRSE